MMATDREIGEISLTMKHLTEQFREHADATRDRLDRIDEHLEASDRRFEVLRTASEVDIAVKGLMMRAGAVVLGIGSAIITFLTINFPTIMGWLAQPPKHGP